ncbi:hypothetical protein LOZ12_001335 [Ophidiomyces ophidiicola]|nr:hypothetical protein LOZ62_003863 [Ophidiomyces ophidiicola]KAI2005460.1 hypothetical protein LOZ50_003658 [Ophidiomyces ophidiicola]KAI2023152.1 hypothetical protein LOZ45_004090 [Ophidiomyces ophidiicola]KAI2051874.1 hypothetical protein LOZ38_002541 [Ophidiomyces ophidiicola]KAI2077075.1 hypothetical protein LOZ39_002372 [Ophidiomyces ophidiicola]
MVTATRRSILSQPDDSPSRSSFPVTNGKRKTNLRSTEVLLEPTPKRRRGQIREGTDSQASTPQPSESTKVRYEVLQAVEIRSSQSRSATRESSLTTSVPLLKKGATSPSAISKSKAAHVRFGSQEPEPELDREPEPAVMEDHPRSQNQEDGESDDDDAPEAISNTNQLQKLKEFERKRVEAKQRQEQSKKEKRREHENRLKMQAKPKSTPELFKTPSKLPHRPKQGDVHSESSATLQGSVVKAPESPPLFSLPRLLPDEILLAEPSIRPPTPPRDIKEQSAMPKASGNKIRFFDTVTKPPKDIKVGGASIRVLGDSQNPASNHNLHNALPPKASKKGRHVRENWIAGNRSGAVALHHGLRRTAGGTSGFLRK